MRNSTSKFTEHVKVRLSKEDAEAIRRKAELAGIGVSSFLREAGVGRQIQSTCDMRMLAILSQIGGMCRQLWKENRREEARIIWAGLDNLRKTIEAANDR